MKISMKILAASVALASLGMSGAANATIQMTNATTPGELFMTAWDQAGQQSYSRDLGIMQPDFLTNPSRTLTYNLNTLDTSLPDANWAKFISTGSKGVGVVYTVTGANLNYISPGTTTLGYGFVTTSPSAKVDFYPSTGAFSELGNSGGGINYFAQDSNAAAGQTTQDAASVAQNNSSFSVIGDTGYFGKSTWNINDGDKFLTIGNIDHSVAFYSALMQSDYSTTKVTTLPNVWKLTKAGDLTYAPSAVPVPAALWLFGSGLLGLVSIGRRRKV